MLWPFKPFNRSRTWSRDTIGTIYGMIVAQARDRGFYQDYGVPDDVDGRFDLLVLHLWLVLRHMGAMTADARLSQAVFDQFCTDMDANLREMGVGDLTVPKRMKAFGEAFYGRSNAYDAALAAGSDALPRALDKNIYNGRNLAQARRLADYVEACVAALSTVDGAAIDAGAWRFAPLAAISSVEVSG